MRPGKGSYLAASSSAQCRDRSLRCSGTIMPSHAAVIYVYMPTVCRIRYSKYGIGISWISGSSFKSHGHCVLPTRHGFPCLGGEGALHGPLA